MSVGASKGSTSSPSRPTSTREISTPEATRPSPSAEETSLKTGTQTDRFEVASAQGPTATRQIRASTTPRGTSGMNVDRALAHLNANTFSQSQGKCALHVRQAIEAGGVRLDVNTRPVSAKDYGAYLGRHGFTPVDTQNYVPQRGDVAVIQPYPGGSPDGHIAMYDGNQWVSDFRQRDMWSGPGYRQAQPPYEIYRP
ncbi:CHAP domain-containing protein [Stigmatella aurantiaca]|uniref:Putative cytoplasmic protein n=1 Tax=Stigmatella aurantiaca (strain DW4/3-1) TaxID=378806 RepID=Q099M1_STIAD|nr:CHAP domain-containing protein [Stigmatella aurantiaca]EAU68445.1 putative cytoplasmic protein [Stigmatella aurantiaca DW4/3-1]